MANALVVYSTRTGETQNIAELIAEGIRMTDAEAKVTNVTQVKQEVHLGGYDAYVFGSPTYHGQMMQGMQTILFLAEKLNLEGKIGGAFGAFGWSGEAPGRIFDTMKNIFKMEMVNGPLNLKSASLGGGTQLCHEYGKKVGNKINKS